MARLTTYCVYVCASLCIFQNIENTDVLCIFLLKFGHLMILLVIFFLLPFHFFCIVEYYAKRRGCFRGFRDSMVLSGI